MVANRRIDNTNPTGSITSPAGGANVSGSIALASNSADAGSGVDTIVFQRSPAGAGTWTNQSSPWATSGVTDGLYDLRVVTTDNAGNSFTSAAITVRVDNTNPTGSITAPADGASVRALDRGRRRTPPTRAARASAPSCSSARRSGSDSWTTIDSDTLAPYSVAFDTTAVADGQYDLRAVTSDLAGNSFTSGLVSVTVDNTSPNTSITSQPADPTSSVERLVLLYLERGRLDLRVPHRRRRLERLLEPQDLQLARRRLPHLPGPRDRRGGQPRRLAGRLHLARRRHEPDRLRHGSGRLQPTSAARSRLTSNSADAGGSGVATVQFQRSPIGAGTWTNQAASWNTTLQADGQYDLRVVTTDNAGNSFTSATITVRVDNTTRPARSRRPPTQPTSATRSP